jgi:hypothetical protein
MNIGYVKVSISKKKLMNGVYDPDRVKLVQDMPIQETDNFYEPASEVLAQIYSRSERT